MSNITNLLARVLDTPSLARVFPACRRRRCINSFAPRGLDACGELAAAATPAQLTSLLDLDLSTPPTTSTQ